MVTNGFRQNVYCILIYVLLIGQHNQLSEITTCNCTWDKPLRMRRFATPNVFLVSFILSDNLLFVHSGQHSGWVVVSKLFQFKLLPFSSQDSFIYSPIPFHPLTPVVWLYRTSNNCVQIWKSSIHATSRSADAVTRVVTSPVTVSIYHYWC